jgi:hypothetical protein
MSGNFHLAAVRKKRSIDLKEILRISFLVVEDCGRARVSRVARHIVRHHQDDLGVGDAQALYTEKKDNKSVRYRTAE